MWKLILCTSKLKQNIFCNSIKDVMCRIDIPLTDCKVPCFNMTPAKSGVATHKNGIESHANLTDCHGHAL